MTTINTWQERCESHPEHQNGMITNRIIQDRMQDEIVALRAALDFVNSALIISEISARRYLWLRKQLWNNGLMAVVMNPRNAIKLGSYSPSHEQLDFEVDKCMKKNMAAITGDAPLPPNGEMMNTDITFTRKEVIEHEQTIARLRDELHTLQRHVAFINAERFPIPGDNCQESFEHRHGYSVSADMDIQTEVAWNEWQIAWNAALHSLKGR